MDEILWLLEQAMRDLQAARRRAASKKVREHLRLAIAVKSFFTTPSSVAITGVPFGARMSMASWRRPPLASSNMSRIAPRLTPATGMIIGRGASASASRIKDGSFAITGGGAVSVAIGAMTAAGTGGSPAPSDATSGGGRRVAESA